eukprot:scaffold12514_cov145-Amphora_coffeaeformis.AAC.2
MGRTQYETIQHDEEDALVGAHVVSDAHHPGVSRRGLLVGALCLVALTATVTLGFASRNNGQMTAQQQQQQSFMSSKDNNIPMEAEAHARACTFDECNASNCNHEVAPYTCLFHNGGPHGGW